MADYKQIVESKRQAMLDALLLSIESNPKKWESGWVSVDVPYNAASNKNYNGLNALFLYVKAQLNGFNDARWVTFNQAKELGASIKAGEKASEVFYWTKYDKATKKPFDRETVDGMTDDERAEYIKENVRPVLKFYQVFNAAQCKNFPESTKRSTTMSDAERAEQNERIETIIKNSAAPIIHDGRAYYSPTKDNIHLPVVQSFKTMQDYYATALHEIGHSTGHQSRLNRDLTGRFGSESYAIEELRAELASVFIQSELGINLGDAEIANHGAYLKSWLSAVKKDVNVFYHAAADAGKISDYIKDNYMKASKESTQEENQSQETEVKNNDTMKAKEIAEAKAIKEGIAYVVIEWSEHSSFNNNTVLTFSEADKQLQALNIKEKDEGYYKTKLHVCCPGDDGKADWFNDCRFNIGYELDGGLIRLISDYDGQGVPAEERYAIKTFVRELKAHIEPKPEQKSDINDSIKEWYDKNYPGDEVAKLLPEGVTFKELQYAIDTGTDVYDTIGVNDSVVRERLFTQLADIQNMQYEDLYKAWMSKLEQVKQAKKTTPQAQLIDYELKALNVVLNSNGVVGEYVRFEGFNHVFNTQQLVIKYGGMIENGQIVITPELQNSYDKLRSEIENSNVQTEQSEQTHQVKTPRDLYRHYQEIKESTPNAIYFQRIGDFYEVMGDDAKPISEELGLTLTSRDVGLSERIPMIGVPYHAVDMYVEKLRDKYNVLIDRKNGLESLKRRMTAEEQEKLVIDTIVGNTPSSQKTVNAEWVALASTVELSRVLEIAKKYGSDIKDGELTITEQMRGTKKEADGTQQVQQVEQARQVEQVKQVELVMPLENRMKEYGKSTMIKMPNGGEYSSFVFLTPTRFLQADEKNVRLVIPSNFEFTLSNDGRELVLTGEELRTSLEGKKIGKSAHRVAPSKRNVERLEAIRNNTPAEMKEMPNWCVYRTKWNPEKGKKDKFVLSVHDGKWAKINDRSTWTDFESAYKYALENNCDGLSFALDGSGITCIDLDKCIDTDGKLNDAAQKLVPELAGTYVERSASGNGLHFFLKDDVLANNTIANRVVTPGGAEIEVYDNSRFISMTGDLFGKSKQSDLSNLSDKPNKLGKCPMQTMSWLRLALGPKNKPSSQSNPQSSSERRATDLRYQSDSEVLERIRRSRKGEQFDTLYGGGDITGDKSRDDLAFLNTLAFFTDCNEQQMQRIFEGSGRFRPETKNAAYLQRSIRKACDSLSVRFGQNQGSKPGKIKK